MFRFLAPVVRVMAVVLLSWTAVDLAYAVCCLDGAANTAVAPGISDASSQPVGADHAQVDDCFCCAVCVDTGVRIPILEAPAGVMPFVEPIRHLASRAATLDHPPQNP